MSSSKIPAKCPEVMASPNIKIPKIEDTSKLPLESGIILEAPILRVPSNRKYLAIKFPISPEPIKANTAFAVKIKLGEYVTKLREEKTNRLIKTVARTASSDSPVTVAFLMKNVVRAKKNAAPVPRRTPNNSFKIIIFSSYFGHYHFLSF